MSTIKVAQLGEGDVFLGLAEVEESAFDPAQHVRAEEFGGGCDNAPGQYTWNRAEKRFEPLLNEWDRDFGMLVQRALELAAPRVALKDADGEAAREVFRLAQKRFQKSFALFLAKGA